MYGVRRGRRERSGACGVPASERVGGSGGADAPRLTYDVFFTAPSSVVSIFAY